jgi:hypothetical protein
MYDEPIHITVPGCPDDPRVAMDPPPGVVIHRVPALDPRDVTVVNGIPTTTLARTLIDLAESEPIEELRPIWRRAFAGGLVTADEIEESLARVEWRPSLPVIRELLVEFAG